MPIDLIFIIVFGLGFRHGYSNGIISTVFNIVAYVFGIMLAFKITPATTNILERLFHSQNPSMFLAAFIVNVAIIMLVLRQAAKILEGFLQAIYLGIFNRILGGAAMAAIAILLYSVLLWFAVRVNIVNDSTIAESKVYPLLRDLPPRAKELGLRFRPIAREMWDTSLSWMDKLDTYGVEKTESLPKVYQVPDDGKSIIEGDPRETAPRFRSTPATPPTSNNGIEE